MAVTFDATGYKDTPGSNGRSAGSAWHSIGTTIESWLGRPPLG